MPRKVFGDGTIIRAKVTYTDPDTGVVIDPNEVSVIVRSPDGALTTYEYGTDAQLVRTGVGLYYVLITLAAVGTYKWKWTGTASEQAVVDYDECDSERKF